MAQQPIGQGGLFEARLETKSRTFRWVYDCGSNQREPLLREIRRLARVGSIDLLFISHLDSDHINGVHELLSRVTAEEVILPYLKAIDLALIVCRDSQRRQLTSRFAKFAADPAGWFLERGTTTVSFIKGRLDDGRSGDGPDIPRNPLDDVRGPLKYKWSRPPTKFTHNGNVRYFDTSASIWFTVGGKQVDWLLAPYAYRPSVRGAHEFLRRLRRRFGWHYSIPEITATIGTGTTRTLLRYCYDAISRDQNLISMCLYSGTAAHHVLADMRPPRICATPIEVGWISTGDSNLAVAKRRTAFLQHYRPFLDRVGLLVLPHHGASRSFHPDLLTGFPNLGIGIAAAESNGYGHPHRQVQEDVRSVCEFHQVTANPSSRLTLCSTG